MSESSELFPPKEPSPENAPPETASGATAKGRDESSSAPSREAGMDPELARLRKLIFQRELLLLEKLDDFISNPRSQAEKLSSIVAESLVLRASKDNHLDMALEPLVDKILRASLRSNPQEFTNALFPLMGPSIRKSIAETFRSMLESFSKSMEMAFSWKGLRWRFEAMRTGKSFSEVVLLHTLIYRVEEVYFIHSATGIDLMHVVNEGVDSRDSGMISAMLTAIQDFVQDCLISGKKGDLESMQHGEHIFMVEKHPIAYLACIVRGTPPSDFREQLRLCLEYLLVEYGYFLENFKGDTAPFASSHLRLEKLLSARYVDEGRPIPLWAKLTTAAFIAVLAAGFGYARWSGYREEQKKLSFTDGMWNAVDRLRREPGLVLFEINPDAGGPWEIHGLKDEIARTPEEVLREASVEPSLFSFHLLPFVSYDPEIVRQRIDRLIQLPETASMRYSDGVLRISGTAPMEWITEIRRQAILTPGVKKVDTTEISDPRMEELLSMVSLVENTVVEFPSGSNTPVPQDLPKLAKAVDTLAALERLAKSMGMSVSLTIYGHADATGSEQYNYDISQARAKTIAALLYARGSSLPLALYGMGADYADKSGRQGHQASRKIEMRVHLAYAGEAPLGVLGAP
jgi:OOP family OmpA-OmpF porin